MAEVEKIWIIFNLDNDNYLDIIEMSNYIQVVTRPYVKISEKEILDLIKIMDTNKDDKISKQELTDFMRLLYQKKVNLQFVGLESLIQ